MNITRLPVSPQNPLGLGTLAQSRRRIFPSPRKNKKVKRPAKG